MQTNKKPTKKQIEDEKKRRRNIRDRERRFQAMTPAQQRVKIAKDVLAQLATKAIRPDRGTYLASSLIEEVMEAHAHEDWPGWHSVASERVAKAYPKDMEVRDVLDQSPTCTACAIGSMFVCAVKTNNKLKIGDTLEDGLTEGDTQKDYLRQWFDADQLELIEAAFEGDIIDCSSASYASLNKATEFSDPNSSAKKTLKKIMNNIIANKGTFIP